MIYLICSGICDFFASLFSIEIVIGIEFAGIIAVYDFDGDFDSDNLYRQRIPKANDADPKMAGE
jgi:hypothetical protein